MKRWVVRITNSETGEYYYTKNIYECRSESDLSAREAVIQVYNKTGEKTIQMGVIIATLE